MSISRIIVGLFVTCLVASPAVAAPSASLDSLADGLKAAKRAGDAEAIRSHVDEIVVLHRAAGDDASARKGALKLLGSLAKSGRDEGRLVYVLAALGKTGDPRAASSIQKWLRQRDRKTTTAVLDAAIAAAGRVDSIRLAKPLLKLVDDSKHADVARRALMALGAFEGDAADRAAIFFDMVKLVRRKQPGNPNAYYQNRRGAKTERWMALSGALPLACALLIPEREFANTRACFELARTAGGNAKKLIP